MVESKVAFALAPIEKERIVSFFFIARSEEHGTVGSEDESNEPDGTLKLLLAALVGYVDQAGISQARLLEMLSSVHKSIERVTRREDIPQ